MPTTVPKTKPARQAQNARVIAGIAKDLAKMASIQLEGVEYTPSTLSGVFQADTDAMIATDAAHKALTQAVLAEQAAHAKTALVLSALRRFLLAFYGTQAVTVLGDFGMNAPRSTTASKTVTTKAIAVAKTKATRTARGTKGPVAKLAITGSVDEAAITTAINEPSAPPVASEPATATPPANAPGAATPVTPATAAPAAPTTPKS